MNYERVSFSSFFFSHLKNIGVKRNSGKIGFSSTKSSFSSHSSIPCGLDGEIFQIIFFTKLEFSCDYRQTWSIVNVFFCIWGASELPVSFVTASTKSLGRCLAGGHIARTKNSILHSPQFPGKSGYGKTTAKRAEN